MGLKYIKPPLWVNMEYGSVPLRPTVMVLRETSWDIRSRPLMIWGVEEKSKMDLFFPREGLLRIFIEKQAIIARF